VSGHLRAEWIRFRKRRSLQVIILAVPLLVAFLFAAGYGSLGASPPAFDPVAVRADLVAQGYGVGLPPDQLEQALNDAVEAQRFPIEQALEDYRIKLSAFAFPVSLVTLLGSGSTVFLALVLLVATTFGDEFSWGTIRTTLLASSNRRRLLVLRLAAVIGIGVGMVAALALLGVVLPLVLTLAGAHFPPTPGLNLAAFAVLVLGTLEGCLVVVAFGALATLLVRSGSLTFVVLLVYVAVEASVLTVLSRLTPFQEHGDLAWLLDAFPVRGIARLTDTAARVASGLPRFPGEAVPTDLGGTLVPIVALLFWAFAFLSIAYVRFTRMDVVE